VSFWHGSPAARAGHLCLVRYEDLRERTDEIFSGTLRFLGVDAEPAAVRGAIANNSLEVMRAKEDESVTRRGGSRRGDLRFVDTGTVKGWREALTPGQLAAVERRFGGTLEALGYELGRTT
jgi:hypothetical protein